MLVISWLGLMMSAAPATSTMKAQASPPAAQDGKSPAALRDDIMALYQKQQLEAAAAALGEALRRPNLTTSERAQFHALEGLLDMETFNETAALKAFGEALSLDPTVELPRFAVPKTARFFTEVRAVMHRSQTPLEPKSTAPAAGPPLRSWAWAPVAGGIVAGGFGFMLTAQSRWTYDHLLNGDIRVTTVGQLDETISAGKTMQVGGFALIGVGVVGLASGVAMYFLDVPGLQHIGFQPTKSGATMTISGVIP